MHFLYKLKIPKVLHYAHFQAYAFISNVYLCFFARKRFSACLINVPPMESHVSSDWSALTGLSVHCSFGLSLFMTKNPDQMNFK